MNRAPAAAHAATTTPTARVLASSAVVALAVIASLHALESVIVPGGWTGTGVRLVLLLAVVTAVVRVLRLREDAGSSAQPTLLPSLAGLVVGLWGLLGLYGGPTDRFSLAVGLTNVDRVVARLGTARELAAAETAPIDPSLPIALMAVGGVVVVFLVTDLLVGGLRLPAAAALPLLALWVPGLVIVGSVPTWPLVVTVAALILLLALDNPYRTARRLGAAARSREHRTASVLRATGTLGGAAAVTVAALLLGTASAAVPQVVSSSWSRVFASEGRTVRLADDLDMRRNLGERSGQVVMRYETDGQHLGPLRMFTLTGFDGTGWLRGQERDGTPIDGADQLLWPDPAVVTGEGRTARVTLESLRDTKLPVPTEPRSVDVDGTWSYDAVRDEVLGAGRTEEGTTFTLTAYDREITPDSLRGASGADPDDPNYLEVPATDHAEQIREVAEEVTVDATSRYDQALALQSYFRDSTAFTYSTEVPRGETGDTVWDFLQDRTGYCVQFATSMTVMARSLGIPARVGVGFLPGERVEEGTYEVTGRDSHAWPELYFPGHGWVRFEPTPAQQSGPVPRWADPASAGPQQPSVDVPQEVPTFAPDQDGAPTPSAPAPSAPSGAGDGTSEPSAWPWLVAGSLVLLLLASGAWWARRRRREPDRVRDAESAWEELAVRLDEREIRWPSATTPRRVPPVVATQVRSRTGRPLGEDAVEALTALSTALESQRYARTPVVPEPAELDRLVEAVVSGVDEGVSARPARDGGPTAPRAG